MYNSTYNIISLFRCVFKYLLIFDDICELRAILFLLIYSQSIVNYLVYNYYCTKNESIQNPIFIYPLNPPHSLSVHSTFAIFILSTRLLISTVDMFPQKKNPGIQATLRRLSEYPEMLYFKAIYTIYFCTFDSNTTVSTWSVWGNMSTG